MATRVGSPNRRPSTNRAHIILLIHEDVARMRDCIDSAVQRAFVCASVHTMHPSEARAVPGAAAYAPAPS